jgi:hypothetical protein|tara:strand:+ start:1242 stop:2267 length:1026 start_codon:yes stop_codon:yes gene_type:complete
MPEPITPLSASRIKTAQSCSWLYWCKYKLKLPEKSNDGARRGSICHLVFEVLGIKRRKKHFDAIIKSQDVFSVPSIKRLVIKHAVREGVDDQDNIDLMKEMIYNGLTYDFFGEDLGAPTKEYSEKDFDIVKNDGKTQYKIRGFIDKLFLYKKQKFALIRDFKTSKDVFKGKDQTDNLQDLMYSLAVKNLFPEYSDRVSEFLFLKFDLDINAKKSGVIRMKALDEDELTGFEMQLSEIQKYLDGFSEKDARRNYAAHQGFPTDNSFSGKLLCGFATQKGELKKDGSPKWHCPMKFDFFFYEVWDSERQRVGSYFEEDFTEKLVPEGGGYEMKYYQGCPAHSS